MSRGALVLAAALLAGCYDASDLEDGRLACSTVPGRACPIGFHCAADGRCWRDGQDPPLDLAVSGDQRGDDLAVADLAEADLSVPPDLPAPDLSTPDLAMPDLSVRDLSADAAPDASPSDLANTTFGCTVTTFVASVSATNDGPDVAYSGGYYGLVFPVPGFLAMNLLDPSATPVLKFTNDQLFENTSPPSQNAAYARITAGASGQFAIAWGYDTQINPGTYASGHGKAIADATGIIHGPVRTAIGGDSFPPIVGGVAFDPGTTRFVGALNLAPAPGFPAAASLFSFDANAASVLSTSNGNAYVSAIAWAPTSQRFGQALISGNTASGGTLNFFDANLQPDATSSVFTGGSDAPNKQGVAVAAQGSTFGVVWTDGQSCAGCTSFSEVFLTSLTTGGARSAEVHVSASTPNTKSSPRVAWDGTSWVVAWLEQNASINSPSTVYLRRFAANLTPLQPLVTVSSNTSMQPIGLAVAGPNDYGVGYKSFGNGSKLGFGRVQCAGP